MVNVDQVFCLPRVSLERSLLESWFSGLLRRRDRETRAARLQQGSCFHRACIAPRCNGRNASKERAAETGREAGVGFGVAISMLPTRENVLQRAMWRSMTVGSDLRASAADRTLSFSFRLFAPAPKRRDESRISECCAWNALLALNGFRV